MLALDHAASGRYRSGAGKVQRGRGLGNAVRKNVTHSFFHSQASTGNSPLFESFGNSLVRTLVFLPQADFRVLPAGTGCNLLARAVFLKRRADKKWLALGGQDEGKQALAEPPVD